MGQTYSVCLEIKVKDGKRFNEATVKHIAGDNGIGFSHEAMTEKLVEEMITVHPAKEPVVIERKNGWISASNTFDATYRYETWLGEWFSSVAKYLEDGSKLVCYPDNCTWMMVVKNGEVT